MGAGLAALPVDFGLFDHGGQRSVAEEPNGEKKKWKKEKQDRSAGQNESGRLLTNCPSG